ncbi:YihY/virulence factor BrkB family protein [Lentzea sp. BCCO 10_0856]|uniref:YihY/virulence factor BrkB family protein n=1 Tax=Lentzea miocenica TaxID=3095431 RepID=A0ABU4TBQ9_9PSEU|nr:YihY/virulence factor BrkB family protein [Lentzea sp. BCCO 10_0856]MDX8035610.1 YihY/virulence factor BrkB family protein [Lentzea sp. BCCO 10_0856]
MPAGKTVERPTKLPKGAWWGVLKRTVKEFNDDNLTDWAAALTYYAVLSLFPGLIVLTSALALLGDSTTQELLKYVDQVAPGQAGELVKSSVEELQKGQSAAGLLGIIGLLTAFWTASGYLGAFMRACNAVYDVEEGRPFWKTVPLRLALTLGSVVLVSLTLGALVLTGGVADTVGNAIGLGDTVVTVWDVAKWPVILLLVSLAFAVLYWAAPNVRQPAFRWVTPGSLLAIMLWALATVGFAIYVANFASYNKTYGSLGGVIVFLVWLWISNIAVLLGAEFDAELERGRRMAQGQPAADASPEPRDLPG